MDTYNKNKIIFNKIVTNKYKIIKDPIEKNIMFIESDNTNIKCKYIYLFFEKIIDIKSKNKQGIIVWSDSNPYIDNYTRDVCEIIRNKLLKTNIQYLINQNNQLIYKNDLEDLIKYLIKNQFNIIDKYNNNITCEWIITNNNNDIIEYYMITDIIYY